MAHKQSLGVGYFTPYRVATYLLLIFAAGHTIGGLYSSRDYGDTGSKVLADMKSVHIHFNGADCTFYGFHLGFGLTASIFMLFSAALANHLASVIPHPSLQPVAWILFVAWVPMPLLSWKYFFMGPVIFSTMTAGLLGWECFTTYRYPGSGIR